MISDAVQAGAVARIVGIQTNFKNLRGGAAVLLPQHVGIVAQGTSLAVYALTALQITSRKQAGDTYGYGSPIERIAAQLFPANGDGVGIIPVTVFPLEDEGGAVAADGSFDAVGAQTTTETYIVYVGGVATAQIAIPAATDADTALGLIKDAIDAVIEMPVITGVVAAGVLPLDAKWAGASGNDISLEIVGPSAGITFSTTAMASGAGNPDVDDALALIGESWVTLVINGASEFDDTTTLGKYSAFGEGRWGATVKRPLMACTGYAGASASAATAITDARKTDRTNFYGVSVGSREMPFEVAGRVVARVAALANDNPPRDYARQTLSLLAAGDDADQWDYATRNDAVSKGTSTSRVIDSVAILEDTVTFYHPDGETPPAYRYVVDNMKNFNVLFNLALIFEAPEWDGAPLLPDTTPTTNPTAKKPKDAVAAVASMLDSLALSAILAESEEAKKATQAGINALNPKRLDVAITYQLSGNTNIISIDQNFGFFFGG